MSYFNRQPIQFEGPGTNNPFAFRHYQPDAVVGGKTMEEQLRFSMAYWHTLVADGSDPFGRGNMLRPWNHLQGLDLAKARLEGAFELMEILNLPFFCFHDVDIAPEGETLADFFKNVDTIVDEMKGYMASSGRKLLWNTANMFSNPRYVHGAATSNHADVFATAAAQVKNGLDIAKELGAENYVFWGGREGYETLLNTNLELEQDNFARFLHMASDYAKKIGFDGQLLIEPKPKEPTTHQYDTDAATTISFLRKYDLHNRFRLNLEANHATLAGHTFEHELRTARIQGMLGSVDANQGDTLIGWDTDEFPTDIYSTTLAMYEILKNGGLGKGGLNFDAKVRRGSFHAEDLISAHVAGMDTFAWGLKAAHALIEEKVFENLIEDRYRSFTTGIGKEIVDGKATLDSLHAHALTIGDIENLSGGQESLKAKIQDVIYAVR
ncbi:xylose isomerase [Aureibacillus halotolerans]|uniref:Xylose isomerase n=1 Tax=Aureibacillus halotolerans TaxID=1508390 RepID=A0A4R6U8N6_9BACI|nr:xylose isomerase [Aureibacillus halotolerans]TDQ42166.1 D-xylose isomerase [Aureibacillus halotolerans]